VGKRAVFFVDAAHFVFGAFLGYLWCFARCWIKAPSGRQRFNVVGALNAITYEVITVTNLTYINSESVCQLLRKLVALGLQVPITLVLDNARYQRCALVQSVADALGIEQAPVYFEAACKRLQQAVAQGRLFTPASRPKQGALL